MSTRTKKSSVPGTYLQLIHQFPLRPIRNDEEYETATAIMDELAVRGEDDLDPGETDYLDALVEFVSIYDQQHFPIGGSKLTGLDSLKFLIEQHDMKQTELAKVLGVGTSTVSMILSGSRPITSDHARTLGKWFSVDPGLFL